MLDSSLAMLDIAKCAAVEAGVSELVTFRHADATDLSSLFPAGSFDVILCHNILEYIDCPGVVLRGAARVMRSPSAILSILVRSQAGEVLKAALQTGDLAAAESALTANWGEESLYRGKVGLFTMDGLEAMVTEASLTMVAQWGVRVAADYLPLHVSRTVEYEQILALESKLGRRREFAAIARYAHWLARCVTPLSERDE
jgi:SAM-dependent methyltransferase